MRVHLIDGTYELFRAHYSQRPEHRGAEGDDVKATVGLTFSLLTLLDDPDEAVTHVAVAFDNPIRSFRNDLFAGYKTEEGVPPELLAQFDLAEQAVAAAGVVVWSMDQWEADDALATGAAMAGRDSAVEQVRILTPDKDLGQCVRGQRVVQIDRVRRRFIDEEAVVHQRAAPGSIPDYLALVGDSADGIPGIAGFGAKTVQTLLAQYPHIEDIPRDPVVWPSAIRGAPRLAARLAAEREQALLYRRLATLVEDVPLKESVSDLAWNGARPELFADVCERLDSETLRARPRRWV